MNEGENNKNEKEMKGNINWDFCGGNYLMEKIMKWVRETWSDRGVINWSEWERW